MTDHAHFHFSLDDYVLERYIDEDDIQFLKEHNLFDEFICDLAEEIRESMTDELYSSRQARDWAGMKMDELYENEES